MQITTLAANCTAEDLTLTISNAGSCPLNQSFVIAIATEEILVTGVSDVTLTVSRAYHGTVAATHVSGDPVAILVDGKYIKDLTALADGAVQESDTSTAAMSFVIDEDDMASNSASKVPTQQSVKAYADALIAANDAMVFKGVIDCSANPNYPAADRGHTYKISVAGKIGGASGITVEASDIVICITDSTVSGDHATVGANWTVIQANVDKPVTYANYDAHSILIAVDDDTPIPLTVNAQTLVGRITGGNITSLTVAQIKTLLGVATASGIASLNASSKVVEQPASISDFLENPPTENLATKTPTSEWAFDHNAAILSSMVHPNTAVFSGYSTESFILDGGHFTKVPVLTALIDLNSGLVVANWLGASDAYVQADAGSSATHIIKSTNPFTSDMLYSKVKHASNAGGTTNTGYSIITATAAGNLTIVNVSGTAFAASYYFWIQHSEWIVPITGYYSLIGNIHFYPCEASKYYYAAVFKFTTGNTPSLIIYTIAHSSNTNDINMQTTNMTGLTAGDRIFTAGAFIGTAKASTIYSSDILNTYLTAILIKRTG